MASWPVRVRLGVEFWMGWDSDVSRRGGSLRFALLTVGLTDIQKFKRLHGILMVTSWGFLLPAGAIIAKFFKHRDPLW